MIKQSNATLKMKPLLVILIAIFISSCASKKDIVYFQDEPLSSAYIESEPKQLVYKADDILTITVSAADPTTAQPFNLGVVTDNIDNLNSNGAMRMQTYLIDYEGNIEF